MSSRGSLSLSYKYISLILAFAMLAIPLSRASAAASTDRTIQVATTENLDQGSSAQADRTVLANDGTLLLYSIQSADVPSGIVSNTLIVTLTVMNNRAPSLTSQICMTCTLTDTLTSLSKLNSVDDPYTLHNVLIVDSFVSPVEFLSSSLPSEHQQERLVWNLGDIPPLSSSSVTLALRITTPIIDVTELDQGVVAYGTLQGNSVTTRLTPLTLYPDEFGDWLKWTMDADKYDPDVLATAASLEGDGLQLFKFVQGLNYESYPGSLRGARGTLAGSAGNSLDKSSLLIALLRSSGIPSRYVHGELLEENARSLILTMFPKPTGQIGYVPNISKRSDPGRDSTLLSEAEDHWWVEAYMPGSGWLALDPSFSSAAPGQIFANSMETFDEVPDELRHKVTLKLKIEQSQSIASLSGHLTVSYPLSQTFNTVELSGRPVTLGFLHNTITSPGMIFYWISNTYSPYLVVNEDRIIEGQSFQELVSDFPFGQFPVTGAWLAFEIFNPNGTIETVERELADRLGPVARRGGQFSSLASLSDPRPIFLETDKFTINAVVSRASSRALIRKMVEAADVAQKTAVLPSISGDSSLAAIEAIRLRETSLSSERSLRTTTELLGAYYQMLSDGMTQNLADTALIKAYHDSPSLIISSLQVKASSSTEITTTINLDLRRDHIRAIAYPDQNSGFAFSFQMLRGMQSSRLEWAAVAQGTSGQGYYNNTAQIFETFMDEGGQSVPILGNTNLEKLNEIPINSEAKARIMKALGSGKLVTVPDRMVLINGTEVIGWWETDTTTGETIGVTENGLHSASFNYSSITSRFSIPTIHVFAKSVKGLVVSFIAGVVLGVATACALTYLIRPKGSQEPPVIEEEICRDPQKPLLRKICRDATILSFGIVTVLGKLLPPNDPFQQTISDLDLLLGTIGLYCVTLADPPLPRGNLNLIHRPQLNTSRVINPVAFSYSEEGSDLVVFSDTSFIAITNTSSSTTQVRWKSSATGSLEHARLSLAYTQMYDASGDPIAAGYLNSVPINSISTALAHGASIHYDLVGTGAASFYAPAISGLGVGSNWLTYTAQLTSTQPYTLELRDVVVTVNGTDTYTGSFTLVTTDTTYIEGSGHTAVPNFADAAYMQADDAHLMIGPASGTFLVGGEAVDASNGLAIAGYTGPITISEETALLDRIELNGDASFFTLATVPTTTVTDPNTPVNFQAQIAANFTDTYTTTVEAPEGWNVELDASGLITATPPLGAEPGEYTILVTAQSGTYPDLFASAVHTVTTAAYQGMALNVGPDPLITVPFGPADPSALPGDTNNGQMQIPGAAFTIDITNTSTTSHTFAIEVEDLPSGWLILSGAAHRPTPPAGGYGQGQTTTTLTLPAGGIGQIGLYISPTLSALPPAHTEYPFTVQATTTDGSGLVQSDADVFRVPAIAFSQVKADPAFVYSSPGLTTTFDVNLRNVGNMAGSFPLIVTQPISTWSLAINSPLTVGAGQVVTQNVVLTTPDGQIGRDYNVNIAAPSGAYTQTTNVNVQIVGPCVLQVHRTAQLAEQLPSLFGRGVGGEGLAAAWQNLTFQLSEFELKPGQTAPRQRVIGATQSVIDHFSTTFPISTTSLQAIVVDLADNTTAAEDSASLAAYCSSATAVDEQVKRLTDRAATLVLQPGAATTLLDRPITYTVRLLNRGTLTTTYNLAVDGLPADVPYVIRNMQYSLPPGQSAAASLIVTPTALGTYPFTVTVTAQEDALVQYHSRGLLRGVDAYVKVLEVTAYPDFVDTGLSHTNLSMQLANQADLSQPALVEVQVTAPDSTPVLTSSVPITLSIYDSQIRRVELGILDTSGFVTGVYTIGVTVTDLNGRFMPQGSGFGKFSVGQAISATARVTPQIVAPGNPVITTTIETSLPGSLRMDLNWTRSVETETIAAASFNDTAALSRALALPTYPNLVWDNGSIVGNSSVAPGHRWASWLQRNSYDMRHFRGTFTLPVGRNITTTDGILGSPYYSPTMVPINDDVNIYLNGTLQFYGGTSYPDRRARGSVPETDGWYIPTGARLNGIHEGENVIDIVTGERWGWGGLGYLELTLLQPLGDVRYQVDTLHHLPLAGLQVLTETVTPPPTVVEQTAEKHDYLWQHELSPTQRLQTINFASQLLAMQPGEIRQVAADTIVSYTVASGSNQLHLGPLYVVAPHIIHLEPTSQIVAAGGQATYAVMLYNPALYTDTFRLSVEGLPPEWINLPTEVTLGAGLSQTVTLTIQSSAATEESDWSFGVVADTGTGGRESVLAELSVRPALYVAIQPELLTAGNHQTVTYTLAITNAEATFRTYSLTVAGLTENAVTLPATIGVASNTVVTVPLAVTAHAPRGWYPFEVQAAYANGNGVFSAAADAVLMVTSDLGVMAMLSPTSGIGGPSVPVLYHLTVTNTGSLSDTYSFNVDLPTGWSYRLEANGAPVTSLSLTPYVFNAAELWLIVTPAPGTVPGDYDFTVQVQSQTEAQAQALVNGILTVTERGVQVSISPEHTTMNPTDIRTWQVRVTNTGSVADTFTLMAGGIVSGSAQFAPASVSLAPGESRTVPLTSRDMDFALPQAYPFAVTAQSTSDEHIQNYDTADITFDGYEAVQVELLPAHQTITNSLQAAYLFVITNTGNIDTIYRFSTGAPGLTSQWEVNEVYIPAHMTAGVLLTVRASGSGTFTINASATSTTSSAQANATASLTVVFSNQPPVVDAGIDQMVNEGDTVLFNGSFTDPDAGDTHTIQWNFGDGTTTSSTLTPTHAYADNGIYTVTLTLTDNTGAIGQDILRVTMNNVAPVVNAGPEQTVAEGENVHFAGAFTDVGIADTHSPAWNFGDGSTATGVYTPTHSYADNGVYTVTLTVIDKDGGIGADTLLIVVSNVAPLVEAGPDRVTVEGVSLQFNGSFTDPGTADTHQISWNFGDGGTATGSLTATHPYTQNGVYTATLTITDDDGGLGNDALVVTVQPSATTCTTMTIQSTGVSDAYIWATFPDTNYNYDRLYVGLVSEGYKRSLLRFDLSPLPPNTTIKRAIFSVNQFANGNATPVEAHRIISGWIEDEVTWNSFDSAYDPNLLGSWLPEANGWYSLEVTSLVQAWVDGTWPNYGVLLDQPAGDGHTEYRATEYEEEVDRPQLTLCYRGGPALPAADFSAAPVRGAVPLSVTFTNLSTPADAITAYEWDFGDGTPVSTEQAPTHVYTEIGTYTVTLRVTVGGQTYQKTRAAYINVTTFPSTGVLDSFNRAPGALGNNWSGLDSIYAIADNQLDVQPGDGAILWNAYAFGVDQEAFVTLTNVDPNGYEQDLLLKSQSSTTWENGVIEVLYQAAQQRLQVWTYTPQQNWVQHGDDIPVLLANGDQLGARARADGMIEVYRNGILLATRDVTAWPYYANGGYIGLWFIAATNAVLDDFGGATTGSTAPLPDLVAFWDDFDPSQETWTHDAALGADDWQLAADYARSPSHAYYSSDPDALKDDRLQTRSFVVPANGQLTFWQTYNFENQCDGGVLEISIDGGATFNDLGTSILSGGYTGILTCGTNPIRTRPAWTGGELGTMNQVTVDLSSFSDQTVLLRFRLVADDGTGGGGWHIDDVRVQGTQVAETLPLPGLNTLLTRVFADLYRIAGVLNGDWPSLASMYAVANNQLDGQTNHGSSTPNRRYWKTLEVARSSRQR